MSDLDMFLAARTQMADTVNQVLAAHRPERDPARKVVTCTKVYDQEPHAEFTHQWPAWREHVSALIVDALFELMIPAPEETP